MVLGLRWLLAAALASGTLASPPGALAAFPGENGKIAVERVSGGDIEIFAIGPDGSGAANLTNNAASDRDPAWSPDGQKIAFARSGEIFVMNADGSGQTGLATGAAGNDPAWSPDGQKIAFVKGGEIFVMNADGAGQTNLTNGAGGQTPAWSPDGQKIAFARSAIFVMNPDGSSPHALTDEAGADISPAWSPDGRKIAYTDIGPGGNQVFVMNAADGSGRSNLTNTQPQNDAGPAWSPDGLKIAYYAAGGVGVRVMNADGSGQATIPGTGSDGRPDWQPVPERTPVIFVHGFLGSKIVCGADELWPNLPLPRLARMELARDGRTNRNCPSAGPVEGQLVETALGSDVYKSTADFLRDAAPNRSHLYAWDWRKNPEEAVAGLDALIDRVRPPAGKVVLMAHSMGGQVVRSYVEDAGRAAKVARAVTVATPYWGSPKALFPFVYGVETPDFSPLDAIFDNDALRSFARHLQGLFFLWPSARYGGWLSLQGRGVLSQSELLDYVADHGGNRSLLATALGAHAQRLDELRTNGVDYQTVVGSGIHTIGSVSIEQTLLLAREFVRVAWVNGDGTVPLSSAIAATPAVRRHFVCGVSHVPLPGNSSVTARLRGFLLNGDPIASLPVSGVLCNPSGFALSIYPLTGGLFASSATARAAQAGAMTLDQAESAGVLEALNTGSQIEAATSSAAPMTLSLPAAGGALRISRLANGARSAPQVYGPLKKGTITVELGGAVTVRRNGTRVKPRGDDQRAPKTNVKVRRKGKRFVLSFRVEDASPTITYLKVGSRTRRITKPLILQKAALRKGIAVQSVDAFGNVGRRQTIKRR